MEESFIIPDDYKESFKRLIPYMAPAVRNDKKIYESLLIYLKLGGEKLARIAIEAYNETHRLNEAELKKRQREEELFRENRDDEEEESDEQEADKDDEDDRSGQIVGDADGQDDDIDDEDNDLPEY